LSRLLFFIYKPLHQSRLISQISVSTWHLLFTAMPSFF
jgi:hypothetical protein